MLPLPNTSPLQRDVVEVPPPPLFRPGTGVVRAQFSTLSYFEGGRANTPARRAGVVYEKKVHKRFKDVGGWRVHPWIMFVDESGRRYCCPDALIVSDHRNRVVIVEVKYHHVPEAWWQLRRLYEPVVRKVLPGFDTSVLEITRSYDPAIPFPEKVRLLKSLDEAFDLGDQMGVLIWKQ